MNVNNFITFKNVVEKIFNDEAGYSVEHNSPCNDTGFDFVAKKDENIFCVEVKYSQISDNAIKECFMQYITSGKVTEVYFTGMFTSNQGDLSVHYYDPESGRIRQYYPDFLAKMADGSYQLIEVKGDNKIDDTVVKAKQAAAEEIAVASGVKYLMYAGSRIVSSNILDDEPIASQQGTLPLGV